MYRIILPKYTNQVTAATELKPKLRGCSFLKGNYKNKKVVFAVYDTEFKGDYGLHLPFDEISEGAVVQCSTDPKVIQSYLDKLTIDLPNKDEHIQVTLSSGIRIFVKPVQLEPRQVFFSSAEVGAPTTTYGKEACRYAEFYDKLLSTKEETYDIADWLGLAGMALVSAHPSIPLRVFEAASIVGSSDIEKLLLASIGANIDFLDVG